MPTTIIFRYVVVVVAWFPSFYGRRRDGKINFLFATIKYTKCYQKFMMKSYSMIEVRLKERDDWKNEFMLIGQRCVCVRARGRFVSRCWMSLEIFIGLKYVWVVEWMKLGRQWC